VPENSELDAIFNLKDNDLLRPATGAQHSPASARPGSSPVRPASASFLLRGTEFSAEERALLDANATLRASGETQTVGGLPTSPIQRAASARPSSRLAAAGAELAASPGMVARNAVVLDPLAGPPSPSKSLVLPTPRSVTRPSTSSGFSKSVSETRAAARLSTPSQALNKLGISSTVGTVQLGSPGPGTLGKARIKAMRTLRDQLMSTSGSLAMNVHPEASPDAQNDAAESVRITKVMVKETIEKNRVDQTWTLLATPGYYEAVGPEQIFKSDTQLGYLVDDKFDKAVRLVFQSLPLLLQYML